MLAVALMLDRKFCAVLSIPMARARAAAITKSLEPSACAQFHLARPTESTEDLGVSLIYDKLSKSTSNSRTEFNLFRKAVIYLLIAVQHVANASMNQIFYVQQLL